MGARPIEYKVVGRYINEDDLRDVVGYHIQSLDGTRQKQLSMEQMALLVGKGAIVNVSGQIYKDKLLYRGIGIQLDSLPCKKVKVADLRVKETRGTENITRPRPPVGTVGTDTIIDNGHDNVTNAEENKVLAQHFLSEYLIELMRIANCKDLDSKKVIPNGNKILWRAMFTENVTTLNIKVLVALLLENFNNTVGKVSIRVATPEGIEPYNLKIGAEVDINESYKLYEANLIKPFKNMLEYYKLYSSTKLQHEFKEFFEDFCRIVCNQLGVSSPFVSQINAKMGIATIKEKISKANLLVKVMLKRDESNANNALVLVGYYDDNEQQIEHSEYRVNLDEDPYNYREHAENIARTVIQLGYNSLGASEIIQKIVYMLEPIAQHETVNIQLNNFITSATRPFEFYDNITRVLDAKLERYAYTISKIYIFDDESRFRDIPNTCINLEGSADNLYYISINKWGYVAGTTDENTRDYLVIDSDTMEMLNNIVPDVITENDYGKAPISKYKHASYHKMLIRLRKFNLLMDAKNLKLEFLRLNNQLFDGKIDPNLVVGVGNYSFDESNKLRLFESLEHCCAFSCEHEHMLFFNGTWTELQTKHISNGVRASLIHEMCHAYADVEYGGNYEPNPANHGDVLYGMSREKYGVQVEVHGRKFGMAVQLAAERSGLPFEIIFDYGLIKPGMLRANGIDNFKIGDNKKKTVYSGSVNVSRDFDSYKKIAWEWFNENADSVVTEIGKYTNWFLERLNTRVEVHKDDKSDDNKETTDIMIKLYDMNNSKVLTYRVGFRKGRDCVACSVFRDYEDHGKGYIVGKKFNIDGRVPETTRQFLSLIKNDIMNAA